MKCRLFRTCLFGRRTWLYADFLPVPSHAACLFLTSNFLGFFFSFFSPPPSFPPPSCASFPFLSISPTSCAAFLSTSGGQVRFDRVEVSAVVDGPLPADDQA